MVELKRILLVEDNSDDEKLTLRALRKNNLDNPVLVARDGGEAIASLDDPAVASIVLVLLDLRLPKVNGLEVLKYLRANESTRFVPVVILTSSNEHQDLARAYELGANSYVRKPVDFDSFVEAVAMLGRYWLMLNEVSK